MKSIIKDFDAVVSALPFFLNKNIAKLAHDLNLHYFDLTEDVTDEDALKVLDVSIERAKQVKEQYKEFSDYKMFEKILAEGLVKIPMRMTGYCLIRFTTSLTIMNGVFAI